jgi:two-component system, OmpR family, response regulator VanR
MRLLIAEDEAGISDAVARGLRREGMAVDTALDGREALYKARFVDYDVVVLDRGLPEVHGDDVCRTLVEERPGTRILMLTAADGLDDLVGGLALGADDYLAKPFAFDELVARVRALGRRNGRTRPERLERAGLVLDPARHLATRDGRELDLSPKEFAVLQMLLEADGTVVSMQELLERGWDENADPWTNTVRMTIMTLRRKLAEPPVIETVKGAGYRI